MAANQGVSQAYRDGPAVAWQVDHLYGFDVDQALDWSIVDFTSLSRPSAMACGYPQSQQVLLIELS
jgi:hypothetical protein